MHILSVLLVVIVAAYQAAYKGMFLFIAIPLLFFLLLPLIVVQHISLHRHIVNKTVTTLEITMAALQLGSLLLFYLCLPGISDGSTVLLFGFLEINEAMPLVQICYGLSLLAIILFIVSSVVLGKEMHKTKAVHGKTG